MAAPKNYIQKQDFTASKETSKGVEFVHILRVFEVSYSIENNNSRVFLQSILKQDYNGDMFLDWGTGVNASIDGVQRYSDYDYRDLSGTGEHVYFEWEGDISHEPDGTKSIRLDANIWQNNPTYFVSGGIPISNKTMTLTTIPRASSISSVTGSALDSEVTVNITRASSNFTHKVEYDFNGSGWKTASSNAGTSCKFTPKASDLAKYIPTTDKGTLTVRVTTYNGSNQIGSSVTKTATLSLPSSYQPSLDFSCSISNPSAISDWGIAVKGYSRLVFSITNAKESIGSSIASYSITGGGYSSTKSTLDTGTLTIKGEYTFTAKITDKRGRSNSATYKINIYDYSPPTITLDAYRCNSNGVADLNGTYLKITSSYSYSTIGKNAVTYSVSCNGKSNSSFTSGQPFVLDANCSIGQVYTVTATIRDVLNSGTPITVKIPTAIRPLTIKKNGKAVKVGGIATDDDTFSSAWNSIFEKNLTVWGQVITTNSAMSTSDRNKKTDIETLTEKHENLFNELNPVKFRFRNIEEKDKHDRVHIGFIAQDVEEALTKVGLTPMDFGGFCKDEEQDLFDVDSEPVYNYALRYDEFIALNTYMIQKLQKEIVDLKTTIEELQKSS